MGPWLVLSLLVSFFLYRFYLQLVGVLANISTDAVSLVERLGHLPLALAFAGSFISKTTIAKYLELHGKSWMELHGAMKNPHDYPDRTIVTTWQISFDELVRKDAGAAKLLRLWGYLDNRELWFQLLQWEECKIVAPSWLQDITASENSFLRTIGILLDYSLIERNENGTYSMHAVVHDWIQASVNRNSDDCLMQIAAITLGQAIPPYGTEYYWHITRRLLPHIDRCSGYWHGDSELDITVYTAAYLDSLHCLGDLYFIHGWSVKAEAIHNQVLAGRTQVNGSERIVTPETHHCLGRIYLEQGNLTEAEVMFDRALMGYEEIYGSDHQETLASLVCLGNLYTKQGRFSEAKIIYDRALTGCNKTLGSEHTIAPDILSGLGSLYRLQGQFAEAEFMYKRALIGEEKIFGLENASTLDVVYNLAEIYLAWGQLTQAKAMSERALVGYEKIFDPEHESVLSVVHMLGNVFHRQGKLAEAEVMYKRALIGEEKTLGLEHISTLDTVHNLAIIYSAWGQLTQTKTMGERALVGYEKVHDPEHESTLAVVNILGDVYHQQGQLAEAEAMLKRALIGRSNILGPEHGYTLSVAETLVQLYTQQGRTSEADAISREFNILPESEPGELPNPTTFGARLRGKLSDVKRQLVRRIN